MKYDIKLIENVGDKTAQTKSDVLAIRLLGDDGKVLEYKSDQKIPAAWVIPITYDKNDKEDVVTQTKKLIKALNEISRQLTQSLYVRFWEQLK